MKRLFLLLLAAPLTGCGVDCGSPDQVDGRYAVFANVLDHDGTNLEAFPSYQSPANGWTEWTLAWDRVRNEVTVAIDGQPYPAEGVWDDVVCGNFQLAFEGVYASEEGTEHDFVAVGDFTVFASHLEGDWTWEESWTNLESETGTFTADGQVSGSLVGAGE